MLITNATVITWDDRGILTDHAIFIDGSAIRDIGLTHDLLERYPQAERIDARGQLVMPGNICAHTHFYGAYARGMAIPGAPPADFPAILRQLWWSLDLALDKDSVRASALVCLVDAIKHGTTSLIDHHASPNFIDGSLDVIADAVDQAGLRAVLCYEVSDRNGRDGAEAGIAENLRFIRASANRSRVRGTFGLHASLTLDDETLRRCADSHNGGFHIHVAEHEADEEDSLKRSGVRVIHRLDHYGILGDKTITAHCIHIDESERDRLAETGTWITHQPRSNMNNGVGAMAFDAMMARDMNVCLGNDGMGNNMWADWKATYLLHKVANRDPRMAGGDKITRMAVQNNARLMDVFFPGENVGRVVVGARADLIFVDYHPYTPLTAGNLPWHILFGFEASMVTTTMVDGKILMRDRQLLTLDERAIAEEALALAPGVWQRYTALADPRTR
ncbi:MAG: putative aminohydrolase SsnA [Anaerolineae bacterium]|nr:putative aminohydrolase SsnA [Anaerolineae bacterium]